MEPERPIEKLLREAAAKRRADTGPPPEMHPATRRLLQAEVARVYPRPRQAGAFIERLLRLWPRLAWGFAILTLLAVVTWIWLPGSGQRQGEMSLARNEPAEGAATLRGQAAQRQLADRPTAQPLTQGPVPVPAAAPPLAGPAEGPLTLAAAQRAATEPGKLPLAPGSELALKEKSSTDALKVAAPAEIPVAIAASAAATARQPKAQMVNAPSGGTVESAPAPQTGALGQRYGLAGRPPAPTDGTSLADARIKSAQPAPVKSEISNLGSIRTLAETDADKRYSETTGTGNLAFRSVPMTRAKVASPKDTPQVSFADETKRAGPGGFAAVQQFAQVPVPPAAARTDHKGTVKPVLASFMLEQNGGELRIVDGDGSVYLGSVEAADVSLRRRMVDTEAAGASSAVRDAQSPAQKAPAVKKEAGQQAVQSYFFRVSGTNLSSQQPLVFAGQLVATNGVTQASTPVPTAVGGRGSAAAIQALPGQAMTLPLSNLRISGKAQIGRSSAIEINAVPVKP